MFSLKALNVSIDFSQESEKHNHDLVGYIIQKYPRKVIKCSVLAREAVQEWYNLGIQKYPDDKFTYLIGTVSLVGEIHGITQIENVPGTYNVKHKDPNAN